MDPDVECNWTVLFTVIPEFWIVVHSKKEEKKFKVHPYNMSPFDHLSLWSDPGG